MVELHFLPTRVLKHRNQVVNFVDVPIEAGKLVVVTSTKIASGAQDLAATPVSLQKVKAWVAHVTTNTKAQAREDLVVAIFALENQPIDFIRSLHGYVNTIDDNFIKMAPVAQANMVTIAHQMMLA